MIQNDLLIPEVNEISINFPLGRSQGIFQRMDVSLTNSASNQEELGICICKWSGYRSKFGRSSTVDAASRRTRWFGSCFWAWFLMEVFWRLKKQCFCEKPVRYGSFKPNIGFVAYAIAVITWLLLVQNWWYVMIELILRVWSTICLKIQAISIFQNIQIQ